MVCIGISYEKDDKRMSVDVNLHFELAACALSNITIELGLIVHCHYPVIKPNEIAEQLYSLQYSVFSI